MLYINKGGDILKKSKVTRKSIFLFGIVIILILIITIIVLGITKNNSNDNENSNNAGGSSTVKKESYVEEMEDGSKINKSSKLNEAKKIDGLTITNIQLTTKDGMTTLLADVINNSGAKTNLKTVNITLVDKDGNELTKLVGVINGLEVGASTELNIAMTSDYVNAYDFKVSIK